jgi:hypothetical protein
MSELPPEPPVHESAPPALILLCCVCIGMAIVTAVMLGVALDS